MNNREQLIVFLQQLQDARIQFNLAFVRDAIMVSIRSPSTYYEIEFFSDGHIEVQTLGPASVVRTVALQEITDRVIRDVNG